MVLCIYLVVSYLISFPLMMGEGKDGRRLREPLARRAAGSGSAPASGSERVLSVASGSESLWLGESVEWKLKRTED